MHDNILNMDKKRILIFSTAYYPFVGGAEIAIKEITDRLGEDFEFDLITAKLRKDLSRIQRVGNVTVYRVGFGIPLLDKLWLPFAGALTAIQLQKKRGYFCFWAMMVTYASGAGYIVNLLRALAHKKHIPIVLSLQEGDSESHLNYRWAGLIGLSWKLALRKTDVVTGLSKFLLHRAEKFGYTGTSVLVPNGVTISVFSKQISDSIRQEFIHHFNKKPDDIFLVTWSRLTHKNAVDDIISALAYLPNHVSLLVMGEGEEGTKLQKLADDLGVNNRVKFLGFIPHADIPQYLSVCDIFIRPSRSEGFGNSFIEAMAARIPVIATPVGGIPDFIDDKETGVFCSPDNPQSIAEAVEFIIENKAITQKIIFQAYTRVVERYEWTHIATRMKTMVFDILHI